MKIQNINNTSLAYKRIFRNRNEEQGVSKRIETLPEVSVPYEIAVQTIKEDEFFKTFLNKKGKISKKEYAEIIKKHPSAIIKAQKLLEKEKPTQSSPKEVAQAARKLKEKYDKEYKNGYIIASIGTSPSPITEVMSVLGSDVIFIPASGLGRIETSKNYIFRNQYPTVASRLTNVQHIINYAKKNGIKRNRKETLILLDYCNSGTSLSNLCDIFIEEKLYTPERIHDKSILNDLIETTNLKVHNSDFRLEEYANIAHDMYYSNSEKVSNVPHFYVYEQENQIGLGSISAEGKKPNKLFKEFDEYSQPLARAFSLCVIHEAMKLEHN